MCLKCSLYSKNFFFFLTSGYFLRAPDNSNFFLFPLKVRVIGSVCVAAAKYTYEDNRMQFFRVKINRFNCLICSTCRKIKIKTTNLYRVFPVFNRILRESMEFFSFFHLRLQSLFFLVITRQAILYSSPCFRLKNSYL